MRLFHLLNNFTFERTCLLIGICLFAFGFSSCLTEEEQIEMKYKPVTIETNGTSSLTYNSFIVSSKISAPQERKVTRGICWNTTQNPEITSSQTTKDGTGLGTFNSTLTSLSTNTTYYVRAYATSTLGTVYGNQVTVRTTIPSIPSIVSNTISSITSISAICGGNITSDGGATITAKGVCWSSNTTAPTNSNSFTSNGTGTGSFTSSITGLTPNTTYYVRAYATNSAGTSYGTYVSFRTTTITSPTISTTSVFSITTTTGLSGGSITSDGGAAITAKGVCWSTVSNPTTSNSKSSNGTGTASFNSSIAGLTTKTTYYVRAYATNSAGTSYGVQVSFRTL